MKWNQGVVLAHGERLSGADVLVGDCAIHKATHAFRNRRDLCLAAAPVLKSVGKSTVKLDVNRFAGIVCRGHVNLL